MKEMEQILKRYFLMKKFKEWEKEIEKKEKDRYNNKLSKSDKK
jgi:hypothetical protein